MSMTTTTHAEKGLLENPAPGADTKAMSRAAAASTRPGRVARYLRLLVEFSIAGFKLRDQRSLLGFLWSFVNPLMTTCVLYVVFSASLGQGISRREYFLYLLIGTIVWNFFVLATS